MRTVRASELGQTTLDEMERTGEPVTILREGRAIALLVPAPSETRLPSQRSLLGTVDILGDVIEPVLPPEDWEAEDGRHH